LEAGLGPLATPEISFVVGGDLNSLIFSYTKTKYT